MPAQTPPHAAQIYSEAQNLINRGSRFGRAVLFRHLGGTLTAPEPITGYPEENEWRATLYGRSSTAGTCDAAILAWARQAVAHTPRTATEGRPDDPYNGAGLAPPSTATPAA